MLEHRLIGLSKVRILSSCNNIHIDTSAKQNDMLLCTTGHLPHRLCNSSSWSSVAVFAIFP